MGSIFHFPSIQQTDTSRVDQLSFTVRFTCKTTRTVCERYLVWNLYGLYTLKEPHWSKFGKYDFGVFERNDVDIGLTRGQSYDNAANTCLANMVVYKPE